MARNMKRRGGIRENNKRRQRRMRDGVMALNCERVEEGKILKDRTRGGWGEKKNKERTTANQTNRTPAILPAS